MYYGMDKYFTVVLVQKYMPKAPSKHEPINLVYYLMSYTMLYYTVYYYTVWQIRVYRSVIHENVNICLKYLKYKMHSAHGHISIVS